MNCDGSFTVSDCIAWCSWLFHYPGDLAIRLVLAQPEISHFLELNSDYYGGKLSFLISVLVCIYMGFVLGEAIEEEAMRRRFLEDLGEPSSSHSKEAP